MADNNVSELNQEIADISATTSGLIQKSTLSPILTLIALLIGGRGILPCADAQELIDTEPIEAASALVIGEGIFNYDADATSGTYPALGGGYWILQNLSAISSLLDVVLTSPANGQVLAYNSSTSKWENTNQAVANIGWSNITGKPVITGTTNPAIAGDFYVGGSTILSDDVSIRARLEVFDNISTDNNLTVNGDTTLKVFEATSGTLLSTLSVAGLLSALAGLAVTGNATVSGNTTSAGNLTLSAAAATLLMSGATAAISMPGVASSISATNIGASNLITGLTVGGGNFTDLIWGKKIQAMNRMVMPTWANSGARPSTGLTPGDFGTNLGTNSLEVWNGSAWKVVALT